MAARILRGAPMAATTLLGGALLYPRTAHAEAPQHYSKKPIYDSYDVSPLPVVKQIEAPPSPAATEAPPAASSPSVSAHAPHGPTPTDRLAGQIRIARLFLYRQARAAEDGINSAADRVFTLERSLTETIASLAPPRESGERLMPGAVYVLVAAMAGNILTRRSNVLLRTTVPMALGIGAGWALLPITMRNCSDLLWTYEERVPAVAEAHLKTRATVERAVFFIKLHTQLGKEYAGDKVHAARQTLEDWVKQGK